MEEMPSRNTEMFRSLVEGFPGGPVVKNLPHNAGNVGLIPGQGRSPNASGQLLSQRATESASPKRQTKHTT